MITPGKCQVAVHHPCLLGEGPVWDVKKKSVCWVDILGKVIHEYTPSTNKLETIDVGELVGSVALCTNGDFVAALKSGIARIRRADKHVEIFSNPESHLPGNRFNDGKCDPAGRFWVGTMALSEEPGAGSLYTIEKDLTYTVKISGVTISNGMAWNPEGSIFYYIDTPTRRVMAYDYDRTSGKIDNPRMAISIPASDGFPDGMTIDREGMLWIGHWDGWQVTRWDPHAGKKLAAISFPVARVTSCTFGGETLRDLYVTSARKGLSETELAAQPLAGSLFVVRDCGIGVAPNEF